MEDDYEFEEEYNVLERVGFLDQDFVEEDDEDSTQRFYVFVDAVLRNLNEQKIINANESDIRSVLSKIRLLKNSKYKNPTGFALGWYVTKDGSINKNSFNQLVKRIPDLLYPVKDYDIIRYGNLWLTQMI